MLTTKVKLGIGTLFACLSILLLSLVAPKASAVYQDGDFSPYTPQELFNRADQIYFQQRNSHLNPNSYYIVKDNTWSNNRVNYSVYSFIDDVSLIEFPENMPTNNDNTLYSTNSYYVCMVSTSIEPINSQPPISQLGYSTIAYPSNRVQMGMNKKRLDYYYSPNVTLVFNNATINPVTSYSDYLNIVDKQLSGFEVYACVTENSRYSGWWSYTNKYILRVSGTYNSQPFTITYPNYPAYFMTTRIEEYQWNVVDDEYVNIIIPDPYSSPSPFIQNIAYVSDITVDGISLPELNYSSSWVHTGYDNAMSVGLNSLLNACKEYLNDDTLTDDFLWQAWTVSLVGYSDNKTYYSTILDYSVVDEGTVPDPDPTEIDWYSSLDQILQTINNNKMYNYLNTPPIGYKKVGYVGQFGTLTIVTDPNFEFQPIQDLDTDAMGFFSWLVNLIVNSPVGVLMLFALTFLVVSAVIK